MNNQNGPYGAVNADDTRIRYDQTNNVLETFLKDLKTSGQTKFWLESCNMCMGACGVEAVGAKWLHAIPKLGGSEVFGQDDMMTFVLFSPFGQKNAPEVKDGTCENEILKNIAWVIMQCSTAKAIVKECTNTVFLLNEIDAALRRGSAVGISYLTDYGSGHFICLTKCIVSGLMYEGYDSWADNRHCVSRGVKEKYTRGFILDRARPRMIEISKGV